MAILLKMRPIRRVNRDQPACLRLPTPALQRVWRVALRRFGAGAVIVALTDFSRAQTAQFLFDKPGNLTAQTAAGSLPPQILGQPQDQLAALGESASFSVIVSDPRNITYGWRRNGVHIPVDNDSLIISNVNTNSEGPYEVVLTNPSGSVTSAPAMLRIDSRGVGMPNSWQLAYFGNLSQLPNGDFDGDGSSNLQEFLDGTDPTNANSVRYRLTVVRDGGSVTRIPDQVSYTNGESVTLAAAAPSNELFHAWLGDVISRDNPLTLVMTSNKTVYARFTPIGFRWTNAASGNWEVAANWTPNLVPGTNDSVIMDKGVTVTLNTNADCLDFTLGEVGSPTTPPTLTGSGTLTVRGNLSWSGGTISIGGTLLVQGNFSWLAGTMSGAGRTILETNGYLSLGSVSLFTRTLENRGTILLTGAAPFDLANGAIITNCAGALFDVRNAVTIGGVNVSARIDNAGTFRKSVSSGTTTVNGSSSSMSFNNYGAVEIQSGTLQCGVPFTNQGATALSPGTTNRLALGGAGGGTFDALGSALVEWTGGTFTLNAGAQLNGAGLYRLNGGSLTVNPNLIVEHLDLIHSSSLLSGAGVVTVAGAMNWTAGTMSGSGRTIIPAGALLNLLPSSSTTLGIRTLENGGTVLWTGAVFGVNSGGVITNRSGGLFRAEGEAANGLGGVSANGRFDNAGTFRKSAGTGTTTVASGMKFTNYNTVDIRSGILLANSGYASSSSALLNCALGGTTAATGYGQLQVSGTVTLSGGLSVDLLPGFTPATNDTFTVVTAGTRNSTFASFFYPSNRVTLSLSNSPTSVILRATDVFPVPQPVLLAPQLVGSNALLTWTAISNVTYRLEFNPDLNPSNWSALPGDVTTTSNTASKLDSPTATNRFYRVRLLP